MPNRASFRQDSGPRSPSAPGSCAEPGRRTPSSTSSAVTEARSDSLWVTSRAEKPGVSVGTTYPLIPSSVCAQITATSATVPLVIHILEPSSTQSSPSRLARVRMPEGLEPKSASVRPKQPIASPLAIRGSHASRWSSLPKWWIANIASEPWTETSERIPESTASSSMHARPYAVALVPAQSQPSRCMPSRPSSPRPCARSRAGISPRSYQSATWGRTCSASQRRTVERISRSSSESRPSSANRSTAESGVSPMPSSSTVRSPCHAFRPGTFPHACDAMTVFL